MRFCSWCISDKATRSDDEDELSRNKAATESVTSSINAPKAVATTDSIARAQAPELASTAEGVFHKYADEDDPNVMSPEGLERLCQSAKIPMEGALPIVPGICKDNITTNSIAITKRSICASISFN